MWIYVLHSSIRKKYLIVPARKTWQTINQSILKHISFIFAFNIILRQECMKNVRCKVCHTIIFSRREHKYLIMSKIKKADKKIDGEESSIHLQNMPVYIYRWVHKLHLEEYFFLLKFLHKRQIFYYKRGYNILLVF